METLRIEPENVSYHLRAKDLNNFAFEVATKTAKQMIKELRVEPPKPEQTDNLLTAEEVSKKLNVSRVTLYQWKRKGWLIPVKLGYAVRWRESDIKAIQKGGIE